MRRTCAQEGRFLDLIKIALRVRAPRRQEFERNRSGSGAYLGGYAPPVPREGPLHRSRPPRRRAQREDLRERVREAQGRGPWVCSECGVKNSGQLVHTAHVRALHLRTVLVCLWCGEQCGYQTRYMNGSCASLPPAAVRWGRGDGAVSSVPFRF